MDPGKFITFYSFRIATEI